MTVNFSSAGSVEVGQSLTITCTITTVERLVVTPMVTFIKMNDTDMEMLSNLNRPYSITTDDTSSVTNYTLILDPVRFEDAGMYTCMAEFNVTGVNDTNDPSTATYDYREDSDIFNLTVDFPPVIVTISKERDDTLYAGTPFFIKCDIMLDALVTIPVTVTNQWTRDGTNVPMDSSDATITEDLNMINTLYHNATLMFYPLDNADDSGMYTCNVEVTAPNSYMYLRNTSASANTSITVMATPEPVVEIVTMGMAEPGEEYMLNCTVTVVNRLIVSPVITWTKRSANNVISVPPVLMTVSNVMRSLYLRFSSLNTSDAGLYTCEASINVTEISMVARNNDTSNLPLEIPIPSVDVSQSRENYFLAGSNLILTCDISVDINVDTPFAVNVTWNMTDQQIMSSGDFGDESAPNSMRLADTDRVNISPVMTRSGFNEYRSTVNFTTLSSIEDSGTYTCIVTIVPAPAYEYVMTSDTNYMNVNFTVTDPMIRNFSASPDSFLGLETSCSDSYRYDNFTLTCTATKPTIVIPDLVIAWTLNGTIETGTVTTTREDTMTTTVTNILNFTTSTASDSGTYRCTASITIPNSPDITTSEESTVTIRPQSLPVAATNVMATVGDAASATTAAISFTIPNIAYTPETYGVKYTGAILQTAEQTSMIRMSSDDITAIDQEFTIMLTGLEEDNTYTYTVDSTNCRGTTSTAEMISSPPLLVTRDITISGTIFTTLPSVDNHTINVTWSPPTTPNGRIMTYVIEVDGYITRNRLIRRTITDVDRDSFTVLITDNALTPGVPYSVTLVAYNEFGRGMPVRVIVFTRVLTPSVSPSNVQAVRSDDGTNMTITWDAVSLTQARGFFEYTIRLRRSSRKRQAGDLVYRVPSTETSYTATDLDDQATYSVSMGLSVDDGSGQGPIAGPTSPPIEISSPASTAPPTTSSNINTIIGIVVGVVLALLLIVLIVVIIIFIVRRGKQADKFNISGKSKKKDLFELLESNPLTPTNTTSFRQLDDGPDANGASAPVVTGADGQEDDDVKEKPDDRLDEEMILERMKPIAVASFHEHVQEMHVDSDKGFEMEYKSVPMQTETSFDIGRNEGNKTKNRFANIFPYDFSRVKLTELTGVPDSDYINACYIDGYNRKDCYIAAQ
ncbi:PREDICTED: netrin receptor DCC-like, partial [Amphimedon queenslandica]|uniref:Protein-tyrosine-phosphatase n=1 Tax=Amphimedon queenslandica TaxID=400682 RepID=A0AAN0JTA1_AMPQE